MFLFAVNLASQASANAQIQVWQQVAIAVIVALGAVLGPLVGLFTLVIKNYANVKTLWMTVNAHAAVLNQQTEAINANATAGNANTGAPAAYQQVGGSESLPPAAGVPLQPVAGATLPAAGASPKPEPTELKA